MLRDALGACWVWDIGFAGSGRRFRDSGLRQPELLAQAARPIPSFSHKITMLYLNPKPWCTEGASAFLQAVSSHWPVILFHGPWMGALNNYSSLEKPQNNQR